MSRTFRSVGVVGLGTMGAGIAEVFARSGLQVVGVEPAEEALARGRGHLERSTGRAVQRGRLTEDDERAMYERVRFTTAVSDLADCDLVIEAIPERMELKRALFGDLDRICAPGTILATNTSSLSVTEIAVATGRPDRVVGMHFFNPAPVMKLVEVVRTVLTGADVVADVEALAAQVGKVDVTIDDRAGFIANALLFGYLNQAVSLYESGFASREDIDVAMTRGFGLPIGPLALLDLIGIDTGHEILQTLYRQSGSRRHSPAPTITQLTLAGMLGRKTARGFYTYEGPGSSVIVQDGRTLTAPALGAGARDVRRVAIVGAAHLSRSLAARFAGAGYEVKHPTPDAVAPVGRGDNQLGDPLPEDLGAPDLVVVAADDNGAVAPSVLAAVGSGLPASAVLAIAQVGTSVADAPVIEAAVATGRLADVVGLHFRTAPESAGGADRGLVEVVRTVASSEAAVATVRAVVERLGLDAVVCGDHAGLLADALLVPYLNDAVRMLDAHYATADDIDAAMTLGCGYPAGPIEVLDTLGLDVALAVQQRLHLESGEPALAPAPLLKQLVTAGRLGRRTGRGFRDHRGG